MSHFSVLVIGKNIKKQLEPFYESSWGDAEKKWDWYQIGGRWKNFFKLKNGEFANSAALKDIDFDGMRDKAGSEAKEEYERVEKLLGSIPKIEFSWKEITKEDGNFTHLSVEEKRKFYREQTAKKIVDDVYKSLNENDENKYFLAFLDIEDYQMSKEKYIETARNNAICTFAVLKNGVWHEKGKMGWWAFVSDEKEKSTWTKEFDELLKNLPEDTFLTIVDCHT